MPRDTTTARLPSEREREGATRRLTLDRGTRDQAEFDTEQIFEALRRPVTRMYHAHDDGALHHLHDA
ncbi:hypothetical protein CTA1_7239 [Colletotrichum tanaceti]|uniref:Uncharacterized protein n=1 Tax=Colletotrichum tanaceti TaxID=1306861 RepID=A0A4V6DHM3_9PEZI|nr:hypothetical protein CTA1_7239 [Colletotrichum tanaceti]